MREVREIPRISAEEIHRTLVETMAGVLRGRIEPDEALVIAMVAEEQLRMLEEKAGSKRRRVN
jgi:hypothetical protein